MAAEQPPGPTCVQSHAAWTNSTSLWSGPTGESTPRPGSQGSPTGGTAGGRWGNEEAARSEQELIATTTFFEEGEEGHGEDPCTQNLQRTARSGRNAGVLGESWKRRSGVASGLN